MKTTALQYATTGFRILVVLVLLFMATAAAAEPQDIEMRARALEAQLMAPCCYGQTVDVHDSEAARQVRAKLRQWLAEGLSDQQILDRFAERYGARILAVPPAKGFNSWLYWLPLLLTAAATAGSSGCCGSGGKAGQSLGRDRTSSMGTMSLRTTEK